jgi:hypothetical protein
VVTSAREAQQQFPASRAIVFRNDPKAPEAIPNAIRELAGSARDHGLMIYVLVDDQNAKMDCFSAMGSHTKWIRRTPRNIDYVLKILPIADPVPIAQWIAEWHAGPSFSEELQITCTRKLEPEVEFFLRRAFGDFKSIHIDSLPGGFSASTFSVLATQRDVAFSSRPLPFFAKIDSFRKVKVELENYGSYALPTIPFNLRPALEPARCCIGHLKGIIVGTLVEGAEPIGSVLKRGTGSTLIYSLFDKALGPWREQAYEPLYAAEITTPILSDIPWTFEEDLVTPELLAKAQMLKDELVERVPLLTGNQMEQLLDRLPARKHRVCTTHGDLNPCNILARGNDSILIDFYSTSDRRSVMADPACLEAHLAFSVNDTDRATDDDTSWADTVKTLYQPEYFLRPPEPAKRQDVREWLWNAVRQIRLLALSVEESEREYQTVLSIYLLRYAVFSSFQDDERTKTRRAFAYVMAERLLLTL